MGNRSALLLVLGFAVWVGVCECWAENGKDGAWENMNVAARNAKVKAEEAMQGAAETMQDAKDKTESWADWAFDTFAEYPSHFPNPFNMFFFN
jgi:hypothetical protein